MRALVAVILVVCGLALPARAAGQDAPPAPLRVYLDCYECDTEYLRQNVVFIDYMRDRTDADLHVLVTTQSTGGGGTSWTMKIIGLGRFQSVDRTMSFTTPQTASSDDRRKEFARQFKLGMAGYAATTAVARDLDITWKPPVASATAAAAKRDPWNKWVFRVNGTGNFNGEKLTKSHSYRFSLSGSRVTENWKINVSGSESDAKTIYTLSDNSKITSRSENWNGGAVVVKSMGPHFSLGGRTGASHSSYSNIDRSIYLYPGFEVDFFPYKEFERRSLTIWYEAGPNFYNYRELTVFDKMKERVTKQQMDVSLRLRQPWGSMGIFSSFAQQFRHPDRYSASVFGDASVRLFKGFSFNVFGQYQKIKDQIALPKGAASTEEILLRLRQLATDYSYSMSAGFSYSFGSIFNSVVNPRFGG